MSTQKYQQLTLAQLVKAGIKATVTVSVTLSAFNKPVYSPDLNGQGEQRMEVSYRVLEGAVDGGKLMQVVRVEAAQELEAALNIYNEWIRGCLAAGMSEDEIRSCASEAEHNKYDKIDETGTIFPVLDTVWFVRIFRTPDGHRRATAFNAPTAEAATQLVDFTPLVD